MRCATACLPTLASVTAPGPPSINNTRAAANASSRASAALRFRRFRRGAVSAIGHKYLGHDRISLLRAGGRQINLGASAVTPGSRALAQFSCGQGSPSAPGTTEIQIACKNRMPQHVGFRQFLAVNLEFIQLYFAITDIRYPPHLSVLASYYSGRGIRCPYEARKLRGEEEC